MKKGTVNLYMTIILAATTVSAQVKELTEAKPKEGPGSYKILNEANTPVKIPFKMHYGKPLMTLEINGKKAALMIDNGILWDQVWLFGSPLVDSLQLKPIEVSKIGGAGESDPTQAYTATNLTLSFENIVFYQQPVLVSPAAAGLATMFPGADGQLCNTFFKHFIVEFDFIGNEVILHNPEQFQYKGSGTSLDIQANESGTYSIPFSFTMLDGKTYTNRVDIDLGGIYPLKIALNNKHQIPLPPDVKETYSYGAQGRAAEYSGKIRSMSIGNYRFDNPTAIFGDEKTSRIHPDNLGVIGLPMFMKFNIIFDYFHNKLYLEPNKNFTTPFK
jgi:hypothetical protein